MATVHEALAARAARPQEAEGKEAMKVVIAGGGTGGHLYIGVAVAKELQRRAPEHEVIFVGARRSLEARIVPNEGFRLEFVSSAGLKGVGALRALRNLMRIPRSLRQSRRLLREHAPDVVVGVGGYSSGPVVLAGWWLKAMQDLGAMGMLVRAEVCDDTDLNILAGLSEEFGDLLWVAPLNGMHLPLADWVVYGHGRRLALPDEIHARRAELLGDFMAAAR